VLRERVHHRDADAMEAAGHLVRAFVELPAGVKLGEHDLGCGDSLGGMHAHRNAPAVVLHGDARVDVDGHHDPRAEPRQRLVDGVVDHLEDEMVQPALPGISNVHTRALANRLQALENLDVLGAVGGRWRSRISPAHVPSIGERAIIPIADSARQFENRYSAAQRRMGMST
jgi:hypothetical protein